MLLRDMLIAADFTRPHAHLRAHASTLAARLGARVTALHVGEGGPPPPALATLVEDLAARGVATQCLTRAGRLEVEALRFAEQHAVHLVAVGHEDTGRLGWRWRVSALRRLVREASVPTLVVREHAQAPDPGLHHSRVLAALDFNPHGRRGLFATMQFARRLRADLEVCHVERRPLLLPVAPGGPALPMAAPQLEWLRRFHVSELERYLDLIGARALHVRVELDHNIARGLRRCAHESAADLIVVTSLGRGPWHALLLGSTTEKLLRTTERPVLVLPRDYLARLSDEVSAPRPELEGVAPEVGPGA